MSTTRRVGLVSSAAAPVLLIGGWTLAAARQAEFDPVRETISALAALDATDRWVMTGALAGLGGCHVVTAWSLRPAATAGRVTLALGGAATVGVATIPLPVGAGGASAHTAVAAVAFGALALWPALSWRRGAPAWALRPAPAISAAVVLAGLVGWLAVALDGDRVGLAERVAAGAQAVWPLVAVLSAVRTERNQTEERP